MSNKNIVITGGSGFIGTNLIEFYVKNGFDVINIDKSPPQNKEHLLYWKKINILNFSVLKKELNKFMPEYMIHLAARTDLNGRSIEDYTENFDGITNLLSILNELESIKRVVFASSMLVCQRGYSPKNNNDYSPNTVYGESKVYGEKILKNAKKINFESIIVRPTSIWGPWFREPYLNYFLMIKNKRFFTFKNKMATKTFGYVGNTVNQIDHLLFKYKNIKQNEVFYLGDKSPINIKDWSLSISKTFGHSKLLSLPIIFVKLTSFIGDFLNILNIKFPINSFRFNNMTKDQIIDLSKIYKLVKKDKFSLDQGIRNTINWLKEKGY